MGKEFATDMLAKLDTPDKQLIDHDVAREIALRIADLRPRKARK
jgi:hypothetical protein